ncbi:histidine phosphatase superfamily [Mycena albidolilacea]|uniref:Phytase A n=1 Tax=Mycena albidolilacea TaxID=1033008 RepID=A0AAD7EM08_9AGAR|nr:histidine phosphatase superfamily [Mycena albidolilacea]
MATLLNIISLLTCFFLSCSTAEEATSSSKVNITELWGAYSPYFDAGTYLAPPTGCRIDQVNLLQRHGARFPTSGAATGIISGISKLQNVQNYTDSGLDFLKTFAYSLGVADLVPFGAHQSSQAGALAFTRYSDLVSARSLPFVRASSSPRVVDTATNWTAGFSAASHHVYNPSLSVILSENGNDTLDNSMCPNAGDSDAQTDAWLAVFAPNITARLNRWAPGANVTDTETYSLISMCPFHTVASFVPGAALTLSPFCELFTTDEFAAFEYSMDLDKYYGTGYGAPLGRVQGVGYVNELLARLTQTPVNDSTQTNTTLTANRVTFPLDRTLYADFSHDNEMAAIYAAMGLFPQVAALDPTHPAPRGRTWVASRIVPFGARMIVERLKCEETQTRFVRVLVNDAVQPLDFCAEATRKGKGVCELGAFVTSQTYARSGGEGDWEKCFA